MRDFDKDEDGGSFDDARRGNKVTDWAVPLRSVPVCGRSQL